MSQEKTIKITTDVDSLRSEIRDKSVRVIDVRREEDYKQSNFHLLKVVSSKDTLE